MTDMTITTTEYRYRRADGALIGPWRTFEMPQSPGFDVVAREVGPPSVIHSCANCSHASDCALHNEPATANLPCDCKDRRHSLEGPFGPNPAETLTIRPKGQL